MKKLSFDDALQAVNEQRFINASEVRADALRRVVWVAEWHIPGCCSESFVVSTSKRDAIADALNMCGNARGAKSDLMRYGQTSRVSPDAYVSMATTTIEKRTLASLL